MLIIKTEVFSKLDYDPFGMITFGRSWEAGSGYRYGFNGMEGDDEIVGNDNALDFGARVYDARLGRWYSIDKLTENYKSTSPYVFAVNNPISHLDIDGNKVVNFYTGAVQRAQDNLLPIEAELDNYACLYGSIEKKKEFSGTKEQWKYIKGIEAEYKSELRTLNELKVKEKIVNEIINEWQERSPEKFNEFNSATNHLGEEVDMIIKVENLFDSQPNVIPNDAIAGYNETPRVSIDENGVVRPQGIYGVNKIAITFEIDESDRFNFEMKYGQDIENHEGGHFLYFIKNSEEYVEYITQLKKDGRDYNGGHNADDKSGQNAKKYGLGN